MHEGPNMLMWSISSLVIMLMGMGGVAFITLLERKILGLSQVRLGPNKVTMSGILQPVADGIKLLSKENMILTQNYTLLFSISPSLVLIMFLLMWTWLIPWGGDLLSVKYSSLLFFSFLGLGAYSVIFTGWSSLSGFSKLGSLRGMLQSLSFEVSLILFFMIVLCFSSKLTLVVSNHIAIEMMVMWLLTWMIFSLMETNRAPFDLLEGESELISGFNIEMGSLPFVLLFLGEYGMIMFMSTICSIVVTNSVNYLLVGGMFILMLFMRSCFPRVRYDNMMSLMWKVILPLSLIIFIMSSVVN